MRHRERKAVDVFDQGRPRAPSRHNLRVGPVRRRSPGPEPRRRQRILDASDDCANGITAGWYAHAPAGGLADTRDMGLRNGDHGYGAVTRTLHWLTVLTIGGQFAFGYTMETDRDLREVECDPAGEDRSQGDAAGAEEERLDRLEDGCEAEQDRPEDEADHPVGTAWSDLWSGDLPGGGLSLPEAHVLLGVVIIALGVPRLLWRRTTPLPPWDPCLSPANRRVVHGTEVSLLALQFLVPATGILLVVGGDDMVVAHIAAHVAFFLVLAAHLGMVIDKKLVPRMLPWGRPRPRESYRRDSSSATDPGEQAPTAVVSRTASDESLRGATRSTLERLDLPAAA